MTESRNRKPYNDVSELIGWTPSVLHSLTPGQWAQLVGEIEAFGSIERRRIFHLAFERRLRTRAFVGVPLRVSAIFMSPSP